MFRWLFLLCLLGGGAFAQTITQAEFFTGPDPGPGNGTPLTVTTPDDSVPLNGSVPTSELAPGLRRVFLRVRDNLGRWSQPVPQFLVILPATAQTRLIQSLDYQVDNGAFTHLDPPGGPAVNVNEILPTAGLTAGLHRFRLRCTDDLGRVAQLSDGFLVVAPNTSQTRRITQMDYRIDYGTPTVLDVADAPIADINALLSTAGLAEGLHHLRVSATDDLGRVSVLTDAFFTISSATSQIRLVTRMEYWLDNDPPTLVDVADAPTVPFNQILASSGVTVGLHFFNLRATDDLGRVGMPSRWPLIVTSPFGPLTPRTITAAEYYVNVDPGAGNGIQIPLPADSVWDEGEETVQTVVAGMPIGLHLVGIRVRDNAGRWSPPVTDSLVVGPILVVRSAGNDIVLSWQSGPGADRFYIYRADAVSGVYTRIDSTAALTYTDPGVVTSHTKQFYRVTFSTTTLSTFRLPDRSGPAPRE